MIRFTQMSSEHSNLQSDKLSYAYAYIDTDEIESEPFPIAVIDYRPRRRNFQHYISSEPVWHFIANERTNEQQEFIDRNFDRLNEMFIAFAKSKGFLTSV